MGNKEWLIYVIIAGLSWGVYVPLIAYGGKELDRNRFAAFLCVGVAYFLIAVLFPLVMFLTGQAPWPPLKANGLIFASLAGVAGAVGALNGYLCREGGRRGNNERVLHRALDFRPGTDHQHGGQRPVASEAK